MLSLELASPDIVSAQSGTGTCNFEMDSIFSNNMCVCPASKDLRLRLKDMEYFMFMGPCIFIYEDHISSQRDATFYAHLLITKFSTCFDRHSPIIRISGTVCAAYGTVMLICVMIGSTVLSMGV